MFAKIFFTFSSILALSSAQTAVDIPLNDPVVSRFNVQVRHYDPPYDISSARFGCIGTVISRWHVLTAASCVDDRPPSDIIVALGSTDMSWSNDESELRLIEKFVVHPNYKSGNSLVANLAVLKVFQFYFADFSENSDSNPRFRRKPSSTAHFLLPAPCRRLDSRSTRATR